MQNRSISSWSVSPVIAAALAAVALLSACGDTVPLHTKEYYEALGSEKTRIEIESCIAEKQQLMAKNDAAGADKFAKSNRSINCLNAALVEAARDAKTMSICASEISKARTRDELHASKANVMAILGPWNARVKDFSEWQSPLSKVFNPVVSMMELDYSNRSVLIEIGAVGKK